MDPRAAFRQPSDEGFDGRARAEEVAVAVGIVDPFDARPELVRPHEWNRERGFFPGVRMRPVSAAILRACASETGNRLLHEGPDRCQGGKGADRTSHV